MMISGLENPRNLCYLNSLVQALIHISEFFNLDTLNNELALIKEAFNISTLVPFVKKYTRPSNNKHFSIYRQDDPLEAVQDLIRTIISNKEDSELFEYIITNFGKDKKLYNPIQIRLQDKDKIFSSIQESLNDKFETIRIQKFPNLLIVSINRQTKRTPNNRYAINNEIHFTKSNESYKYDFVSVVCRQGSKSFAHCTTYAKLDGEWYHFNDEKVTKLEMNDSTMLNNIQNFGILYFYRLIEVITIKENQGEQKDSQINVEKACGLKNLSNNCWLNSMLQTIYYNKHLSEMIKSVHHSGNFINNLSTLLENMDLESGNSINPLDFNLFDKSMINFDDYSTKFDFLIDKLISEYQAFENYKLIVKTQFCCKESQICLSSKYEKYTYVPLLIEKDDFCESFKDFLSEDIIEYNLDEKYLQVTAKNEIDNCPQQITFQICRSYYDGSETQKNTKRFSFPLNFNMNEYQPEKNANYRLLAIVSHTGGVDFGHYISFIYNAKQNSFTCFNDININQCSIDETKELTFGGEDKVFQAVMLHYITDDFTENFEVTQPKIEEIKTKVETSKAGVIKINAKSESALSQLIEDTEKIKLKNFSIPKLMDPPSIPIEIKMHEEMKKQLNEKTEKKENKTKDNSNKRAYFKYPSNMRIQLKRLYDLNQDNQSPQWYSLNTGININSVRKFLKQLKEDKFHTDVSPHSGGRKSKVTEDYARLIIEKLKTEPRRSLASLAGIIREYNEEKEEGVKVLEEKLPSSRGIQRYFHSDDCKQIFGKTFSFQRVYTRGVKSNTEFNKALRKERVLELYKHIYNGQMWVSIDETSWNLNYLIQHRAKGWGEKGDKIIIKIKRTSIRLTAITAITYSGRSFCMIVKGSVTMSLFNIFLKNMLLKFEDEGQLVLWMDNCTCHNESKRIVEENGHTVLFNAPDSPQLNPIEMFFNTWKDRVNEKSKVWKEDFDAIQEIINTFTSIDPALIRRTMEFVKNIDWNNTLNDVNQ